MNKTPSQKSNGFAVNVKEIYWDSPEYRELVGLRFRLFREPFGLVYSEEEISAEKGDLHFAAFHNQSPVGFVSLRTVSAEPGVVQLRQMVVQPELQRTGIGKALVKLAEEAARKLKLKTVVLDAREEAISFYQKLNYSPVGERFFFKTVMHQRMMKHLSP